MRSRRFVLPTSCLALLLWLAPSTAAAQAATEARLQHEQYGGLVVNETVSVVGHDFYRHFAAVWREDELSERFTLSVLEQTSARWGSRVRVEYARRVIYQRYLPISRPAIPAIGREAAEIVRQRIVDTEVDRLLFRETDLAPDEI